MPTESESNNQPPSFAQLGLTVPLCQSLNREGVSAPFPIQQRVIPLALGGSDVLGAAPTGSGKTLAFGLPVLNRLSDGSVPRTAPPGRPRAVVLCPTRELADQVFHSLDPYAAALGLRSLCLVGGVKLRQQLLSLARTVDLVIATPGRLLDLLDRGAISLVNCAITVVDEADHLADLGFMPQVEKILSATPAGAQRLFFSATLDGPVEELAHRFSSGPIRLSAGSAPALRAASQQVDSCNQRPGGTGSPEDSQNSQVGVLICEVATATERQNLMRGLARDLNRGRSKIIFFVRTTHAVTRWAKFLSAQGVKLSALHGNRGQKSRQQAMADFRDGRTNVLVATDIAARGIDVPGVRAVIHLDPPRDAKALIHRSGRTGRAGASGKVAFLVFPDQRAELARLLGSASLPFKQVEAKKLRVAVLRQ